MIGVSACTNTEQVPRRVGPRAAAQGAAEQVGTIRGFGDRRADAVERSYEQDELPDWELVLELSRRALAGDRQTEDQSVVGTSLQR